MERDRKEHKNTKDVKDSMLSKEDSTQTRGMGDREKGDQSRLWKWDQRVRLPQDVLTAAAA